MTAKKIFRWSLVIGWLFLAVFLFRQKGTDSIELSDKIASASYGIFKLFSGISLSEYHVFLREAAHFAMHFILAILVYRASSMSCGGFKTGIVISLLFCLLVAALDELIQCSSPGRVTECADFFYNASGVSFGTLTGILSNHSTAS